MALSMREKDAYIKNVVIKRFNAIWQNKAISSTIFNADGHILAMTEQTKREFDLENYNIADKSLIELSNEDTLVSHTISNNQHHAQAIKQIVQQQAKLQKIVLQEQIPVNFISMMPRHNEFKARLINLFPIFHDNCEVIGLQSIATEFNLFGINEYLDVLQNKTTSRLEILSEESQIPFRFARRQHEILFLLSIGMSQSHAAQILNLSRGSLASVVNNVLCPKFGIAGSNTRILVDKATAMNYNKYIPKSLCRPFIIILDHNIIEKYFSQV